MKALLFGLLMLISAVAFGQATPGTVSFTITTLDNNKHYSPDNVMAIWVENSDGKFVKTLQVQAARRKPHLYTWNAKTGGNKVDAISGPTLPDYNTVTVSWNCKDTAGTVVKDGQYKIVTEFTSEHAQGPLQTVPFIKSVSAVTLSPAKEAYFTNIKLVYTPGN
jgi:hypothetical protein